MHLIINSAFTLIHNELYLSFRMPILKTYFNWSSGKDSALALYYLLQDKKYSVEYLLTVLNEQQNRVSMHGVRNELLQNQLNAIGIPYGTVFLPEQADNSIYEEIMSDKVGQLHSEGFEYAAFGDIFLEDLRQYRENQLRKMDIKTVFPLWKRNTRELIHEFIDSGFKTIVVSINASLLDESFVGRTIDKDFIKDLPSNVDPCGENGEFHTFCFDAPYFLHPVDFTKGEKVYREYHHEGQSYGYWFCDLLPE